jgi:hypothetical protein
MENEKPALCNKCQQWLCSSRDSYCGCCGMELIAVRFSTNRLSLERDGSTSVKLYNSGLFKLYWAAEVVSPEPDAVALFTVAPDYGVLAPDCEQTVTISLIQSRDERERDAIRAHLEIATNDPRQPESKIVIKVEDR